MAAFHRCLGIEAQGLQIITPYLEAVSYQGRYVITGNNMEAQYRGWDIFLQAGPGSSLTMDLKAVQGSYPCLFLENYSNRSLGRCGWMHTGEMDLLGYLMLGSGELTVISFPILQKWCYEHVLENGYDHVPQGKYCQGNDTWGVLVPKCHLRRGLGQHYVDVALGDPTTYKLPH